MSIRGAGRQSPLFLTLGVIVAALYLLAQGHPSVQALLYLGMSAAQAVVVVHVVRRRRPQGPSR